MNWGRLLLVIGSLQFIISMLAAEQIYSGYSPLHNYISDLGALKAPTAPLFNTSVFLLGLLGLAAAALLRREIGRAAAALLALASIGAMGVGIFPEDYGTPHGVSALVAFLFGALAVISMALKTRGLLKPLGVALGALSLAALALFIPRVQTPLGVGGVERLIAYPVLIYFVAYGLGAPKTS
ncbi:DUF998 domain-containing protein [Pyrobaculum ferrireducens]|uniref:DUF998 domain-containing protein n=1 Tax=Pyrobaculum ferrireducens TaxID=1104324 RepID=G7VG44_9CREN|nr:DUF998 domain-containing protein [Pyrobaculum ferrireducens]AET33042.1 hypothetical protein P186_1626 [Pyrobaculum ferrireducens]